MQLKKSQSKSPPKSLSPPRMNRMPKQYKNPVSPLREPISPDVIAAMIAYFKKVKINENEINENVKDIIIDTFMKENVMTQRKRWDKEKVK